MALQIILLLFIIYFNIIYLDFCLKKCKILILYNAIRKNDYIKLLLCSRKFHIFLRLISNEIQTKYVIKTDYFPINFF